MPHGVVPPAQLFRVPSTRVPVGSSTVVSSAWPAAGPRTSNSVVPVMRRLRRPPRTYSHWAPRLARLRSTMDRPWAWRPTLTTSSKFEATYSGENMMFSLVYSWLETR